MPGFLVTMSGQVSCGHQGKAAFLMPNPRLKVAGMLVPLSAPPVMISGCSNPPPPVNVGPDVIGNWIPATHTARVKSMNLPLVCQSSMGVAVPSGVPVTVMMAGQTRVKGM
jgi:hypothetical protein